jgi:Protein of unknown function (DUF4012)
VATDNYKAPAHGVAGRRPRSASRRRRFARRRTPLAVGLIALILIASAGVVAYAAREHALRVQTGLVGDLQHGANDLQLAKNAVVKANSGSGDAAQLNVAVVDFRNAHSDFQHALDQVQHDLLLRGAQVVPGVGTYIDPRINSVAAIARMGIDLADAGQLTIQLDAALLNPTPGIKSGARILALMTQAELKAPAIKADLQRAQDETAKVDLSVLPSSQTAAFAKAKADIAKGLTQMDEFQMLAPAVVEIMGGNGSRTYLVDLPDPAELRGSGGFIGTYSILTVNNGEITLGKGGDSYYIDYPYARVGSPKYIQPPGPLRQFTGTQGYIFGDSLFNPDFPEAGMTSEQLYTHETGKQVDGVISFDPWAVAGLLTVTGPIAMPEWHTTVDASTFVNSVFQQQQKLATRTSNRKQFFSDVAVQLIGRLAALHSGQWPRLISALNTQVTQRHLQIYLNNPVAQKQIDQFGWSGAMVSPKTADEAMFEVESNLGGDKANHWLARSYDLVLTVEGRKLHHKVIVSFVNSTPPGYAGGQTYACYVRLYIPASATGTQVEGPGLDRIPNVETHAGFTFLDGWFNIKVNNSIGFGTARIGFEWDTAWNPTATRRIYWQKQAGTLADPVTVSFVVNGKTYTKSTNLTQDRVLVLSPAGLAIQAGAAGQASIPLFGSPT